MIMLLVIDKRINSLNWRWPNKQEVQEKQLWGGVGGKVNIIYSSAGWWALGLLGIGNDALMSLLNAQEMEA